MTEEQSSKRSAESDDEGGKRQKTDGGAFGTRRPSSFSPAIQAMLDSCNTTGLPNKYILAEYVDFT
jgi:hypothetical protein